MERPDSFEQLYRIVDGLNARFPGGDEPFRIVTRLCEEAGELASTVNHFEGTGVKMSKHGSPDPQALAKEIQDVLGEHLRIGNAKGFSQMQVTPTSTASRAMTSPTSSPHSRCWRKTSAANTASIARRDWR